MLETERLRLRDHTEKDFDFLYTLTSNPAVVRYIGTGDIYTKAQTTAALGRMFKLYERNKDLGLKIIELKETGIAIGQAGILPQVIGDREYMEIGYWIAEDHWKNGYATEIACAVRAYGEQQLQLDEMISLVQTENMGSRKVAEANGMTIKETIELKGKAVYVYSTEQA